ncbi:MAG: hypothetical protein A3B47_03125 [Candidatus Levybacteria bacterium RIFCSPLOWO2_01_FULL_39_24]|nr:MAG: hypothetical protein A2800_02415 [Candidatus Levybacteria bacterium RIFCSPHIGHO2_01_FULL_40_16]OGH28094.1 MAG: hypothetical protein A3E12_03540 [Candidatus Levybacteria bacterium RIFCSPHIGHO2_12_FULL_39_9]OGH46612.1 MAG: hypothetical protein A3B47_03125 [Candidatus Levybacteria bacterium RIFCSPLOWO2_01_FULL_39_24]
MANIEAPKNPLITETGPKPLTLEQVESNSIRLKMGRIKNFKLGSESVSFSNIGGFSITDEYDADQFGFNSDPYWSQDLLRFDPLTHILKTNKYGNLEVYETQGGKLIPNGQRPRIIIGARDLREIDRVYFMEGEVRPSGFVFPKHFPRYPLGEGREITPEELEQMLLKAQRDDKPQSDYNLHGGFARVDSSLVGKSVLLIPFDVTYRDSKNVMQTDAVIVDVEELKLIPRIFYTLTPETKTH